METYRLYLAGDSTVEDVDPEISNKRGWGQKLPIFFLKNVQIINKAKGGRSTKSFLNEGRLQEILAVISEGDYLFIQFGHNDQKLEDQTRGTLPYEDYQENLKFYIQSAWDKRAIPVLVTPVHRRKFDANGCVVNSLGDYPKAMKEVGQSLNVLIIDLWDKSKYYYEKLGSEDTKALFAWYTQDMPEGKPDDTHFGSHGAMEMAKLVIAGMEELNLPFIRYRFNQEKP